MKVIISVFLIVLLFLGGCSSTAVFIDEDGETRPAEILAEQQRSTWVGVLLTIFPGIIWHGVGHRYAGNVEKAKEIEQMEMLSLLSGGVGAGLYYGGEESRKNGLEGLKISLYISAGTFGGLGALGFLGSWLYDIIYTPKAIEDHNKSLGVTREEGN